MKKVFFLLITAIAFYNLNATVRTVNNLGGAQFFDIESAINASSPGDTIYITGSPIEYVPPSSAKNGLTFIGPGFNPDKQNPHTASTYGRWLVGNSNTFIGLSLRNFAFNPNSGGDRIEGLVVKRCYIHDDLGISGCGYYSSVLYESCVVVNATLLHSNTFCPTASPVYSATVRNCLFYNANLYGAVSVVLNVLVDHNVFIKTSPGSIISPSPGGAQINFTNNIFSNSTATNGGAGCIYNNNFSTLENLNINGGTNNLQGSNPQFVNALGGSFSFSHDYHLAVGSPCIGTGTSGEDMGIYAGANPMVWQGFPPIPQMNYMNLIGTQVLQGGSLNVSFQATIKN